MRKVLWLFVAGVFFACQSVGYAASSVDSLVQKLVEKGILTTEEAYQMKSEIADSEKENIEAVTKKQVPEWVQSVKIGGDFRARLQTERREGGSGISQGERVRGRYRTRLNVEAKPNDKAKVVFGIATDGGSSSSPNNPRSNNVTFSANNSGTPFSKPNVIIHKAYGQYMVNDQLTLTAGKMDNPVWEPMEFLWDSDITPEGASAKYEYKYNDMIKFFGTGSVFSLGEFNPSTSDPFMYVAQMGTSVKPNDKMDAKFVFTYTGYGNIKNGFSGGNSNNTNGTNTDKPGTTALKYGYSAPMGSFDIGFNDPIPETYNFPIYIPRVGIFGEFTKNPSPDKANAAWMLGAYLGNSKVNGWGTWKFTGAYKVLGKDAWLDIFPDSDFYGGTTDTKGIKNTLEIGLAKNLSFALDYYQTRRLSSAVAKAPEHIVQYDINWKF